MLIWWQSGFLVKRMTEISWNHGVFPENEAMETLKCQNVTTAPTMSKRNYIYNNGMLLREFDWHLKFITWWAGDQGNTVTCYFLITICLHVAIFYCYGIGEVLGHHRTNLERDQDNGVSFPFYFMLLFFPVGTP